MASIFFLLTEYLSVGNVLLAVLFLFFLHQLVELHALRSMPPGPRFPVLPILGHALLFDFNAENIGEAFKSFYKKYGPVFSIKLGKYKVVVASSPVAVHEILVKRSGDYAGRRQSYAFQRSTLGGKGIILGNYGPAWKFHRKLLVTALRQYVSDIPLIERRISDQCQTLLKHFESQEGNPIDPSDILARIVANVICQITFGKEYDTTHPDMERLLAVNQAVMSNLVDAQIIQILEFFPFTEYLPIPAYKRVFSLKDKTFELLKKLLEDSEKKFDPSKPVGDLVSALLQERKEAKDLSAEEKEDFLSAEYLWNTMEDMFLAGYETTSTTLRWAIAFLVNYPEYQTDIQQQLDETVGRDRMPNMDDRSNLPIVYATIMEVLRLGNIAPQAIPHLSLKDTVLCGHRVPKDTVVIVDIEAVHLDPDCWENPTVFDPYRHIDEDGNLITNQRNFFPFGAGRRACAGEPLAKVELFLFLSWMLHQFTFVPADDQGPPNLKGFTGFAQYPGSYKIRAIKRQ